MIFFSRVTINCLSSPPRLLHILMTNDQVATSGEGLSAITDDF